jgi:hypothetical protein
MTRTRQMIAALICLAALCGLFFAAGKIAKHLRAAGHCVGACHP